VCTTTGRIARTFSNSDMKAVRSMSAAVPVETYLPVEALPPEMR
jgi:hypothetical protein